MFLAQIIGLGHSMLQFGGLGMVIVISSRLAEPLGTDAASLVGLLGLVWLLGGVGGVLGISGYLWITNCLGYHGNEAFAPQSRLRRPARVVRVAPLDIRRDRLRDLQRIFDGPVDVIETSSTDPALVHAAALSIGADAIVIDVVSPLQLAALVGDLRSHLVLRPTFEQLRTSRGELQPVCPSHGGRGLDSSGRRGADH